MKKIKQPKPTAILVPHDVMAQLQCAVFYDRSTGDLHRMVVKIPNMQEFILGDDLAPVATTLQNFYGLTGEQADKAASYLAALPNVRAREERRMRAEARRANAESSWSGWKPSARTY